MVVADLRSCLWFSLVLTMTPVGVGDVPLSRDVVINEIHYDPDVRTERVEFIELYNTGAGAVDLSGWSLVDAVTFTFPAGTRLAAHGFLVVAENPAALLAKFGVSALGPWTGSLSNDGERVILCDAAKRVVDRVHYQLGFPWPTVGDAPGYSIELINPALDNDLGGNWRASVSQAGLSGHGPTPGRINSVYSTQAPPVIHEVLHSPLQPQGGDAVTIMAMVTDPGGVKQVTLSYQVVNPGSYIPVTLPNYPAVSPNQTVPNPDYEAAAKWSSVSMRDDGLNGDAVAGDGVYSVQMPSALQTHRRLVRYRITATDSGGRSVRVPYADDPQQNFAYFVYDGVPAWRGAIQPGSTDSTRAQVVTYGPEVMGSVPAYHLISREIDVTNCQYNGSYDNTEYYFSGTLVYDGQVYDNVHYRIRGQYSTTQTGKNKWKFDFNRGHYFQARDDFGVACATRWDKMNVGTGCCPWWQYPHPGTWDQGTQGMMMNEALGFRLYNLAGVPSCRTNYFQLRVVDNAVEVNPANQYEGDFWGLYLAIEQADGAFLDEHGLPDGNVYRMDGGANKTHQGKTQVADNSDVSGFVNTIGGSPTKDWWAKNVNLPNYYNSRAIGIAVNDSDRRPEANCIFYHDSEANLWWMLPWDLDLTFEWATHYTNWEHFTNALTYPDYSIASKNRAREILDLLFNGDQAEQVIDEIASIIGTPYGGGSLVEANRAMWDYHPKTVKKGQFYENNEFLKTKDWPGLVTYYKTFLTPAGLSAVASGRYGVCSLVAEAADSAVPSTPVIRYVGAAGYPVNDLRFVTSAFSDPQGTASFGAVQWRIAEVTDVLSPLYDPNAPGRYEIEAAWTSAEISPFRGNVTIPAGGAEAGHAYRVRCRMKDTTGRWSHWSNPVQFTAGAPTAGASRLPLQITEVMYNPPASPVEDGWDRDEFEFIELMNVGSTTIDLSGVQFVEGVLFDFAEGTVTQLGPGQFVLVVENRAAFECRYGAGLAPHVAGQYSGKLSNGGEKIRLKDLQTGVLAEFEYGDDWYAATDGQGRSLVVVDPYHVTSGQLGQKASWRASYRWGGSPGAADVP